MTDAVPGHGPDSIAIGTARSPYTAYSYLTAGEDFPSFELAPEFGRVAPYAAGLTADQERRARRLLTESMVISLHDHPVRYPLRMEETPEYNRTGRQHAAYAGLAASVSWYSPCRHSSSPRIDSHSSRVVTLCFVIAIPSRPGTGRRQTARANAQATARAGEVTRSPAHPTSAVPRARRPPVADPCTPPSFGCGLTATPAGANT